MYDDAKEFVKFEYKSTGGTFDIAPTGTADEYFHDASESTFDIVSILEHIGDADIDFGDEDDDIEDEE